MYSISFVAQKTFKKCHQLELMPSGHYFIAHPYFSPFSTHFFAHGLVSKLFSLPKSMDSTWQSSLGMLWVLLHSNAFTFACIHFFLLHSSLFILFIQLFADSILIFKGYFFCKLKQKMETKNNKVYFPLVFTFWLQREFFSYFIYRIQR